MKYKCYRCGLHFDKLETARLHTFITKHSFREIVEVSKKHG